MKLFGLIFALCSFYFLYIAIFIFISRFMLRDARAYLNVRELHYKDGMRLLIGDEFDPLRPVNDKDYDADLNDNFLTRMALIATTIVWFGVTIYLFISELEAWAYNVWV